MAVGDGVGVGDGLGVGEAVGVGVGDGLGVGEGVGVAPESGCQNPPVCENCPPLMVVPTAGWPIVPSIFKLPPVLEPPPPAITLCEISICALVCGCDTADG